MTTFTQNEKGFTLVELAIVLVIVGLLIGGILKGQELIANAQVTATMNQMTGMDAATSTFRDKYNAFPGDMGGAATRLPNCNTPCGGTGNGNGTIDVIAGVSPTGEALQYFLHLRADGLVTGFDGGTTTTASFGETLPPASIGGGYFIGYTSGTNLTAPVTGATPRRGHYLATAAVANADISATNGSLTPSQGARIDNKLDDGDPRSGSVVGSTGCGSSTAGEYNSASETAQCAVYYRIQG